MTFYELFAEWSRSAWPPLANHLWQSTLFALFAFAVFLLLRRAPARTRHSLLLIAFTKFVIPAATVASLLSRAGVDFKVFFSSGGGGASVPVISPLLSPVPSAPGPFYAVETSDPSCCPIPVQHPVPLLGYSYLYGALAVIWAAGSALLFCRWLRSRRTLSAAIQSGEVMRGGRELEALERVRSRFGLRRRVILITSAKISAPGVWRAFRPVVVLPQGVSDQLTDGELEAVLTHEMVHVARWDNLVGALQRAVSYLLWFHPLVWLLGRWLLDEREQACDDAVIKLGGLPGVYASGITKICRHSMSRAQVGLSGAAGSNLKKRIERIVAPDISRSASVLQHTLLCAVAAGLLVLSAVAGSEEIPALEMPYDGVDPRFVVAAPKARQEEGAAAAGVSRPKLSTPRQAPTVAQAVEKSQGSPARAEVTEQATTINSGTPAQPGQPETPNAPAQPPQPGTVSAAIIPASASPADLSQFVGRYEVDPAKVENFVLDITLEEDQLWLKPSHAIKRKLLLTGESSLTDAYSDFRFTGLRNKAGMVVGLRLDSWSSDITARKLMLPQPSLSGNTTFRLSGYSNARIVAVAGSFNNWNQSQFIFARVGGEWVCRINLPPGKYEYKFIVDGNWLVDPRNSLTKFDERGNQNSVLVAE